MIPKPSWEEELQAGRWACIPQVRIEYRKCAVSVRWEWEGVAGPGLFFSQPCLPEPPAKQQRERKGAPPPPWDLGAVQHGNLLKPAGARPEGVQEDKCGDTRCEPWQRTAQLCSQDWETRIRGSGLTRGTLSRDTGTFSMGKGVGRGRGAAVLPLSVSPGQGAEHH